MSLEEAFRTPVYTGNKITINGKTYKSIREAGKDKELNVYNISLNRIAARLREGMTLKEVFSTPSMIGKRVTINGKTYNSIHEAAKDKELNVHNLNADVILGRLRRGYSIEEVFSKPLQKLDRK